MVMMASLAKRLTPRRILLWFVITSLLMTCFLFHRPKLMGVQMEIPEERVDPHIIPVPRQLYKTANPITSLPVTFVANASVACSYNKVFNATPTRRVKLDAEPFTGYTSRMTCLAQGHAAVFHDKFATLDEVIIDPSKASSDHKGGEDVSNVLKQVENKEYLALSPGFFSMPCQKPPPMNFEKKGHLRKWASVLTCYQKGGDYIAKTATSRFAGTAIVIQRYEYANLFCMLTEFYNTFVMTMLTGSDASHVTSVVLVDAHPKGALDTAWDALYGRVIRVRHLQGPAYFSRVVWSLLSYNSPLWNVRTPSVPYLEEFRHFFLSRHNVSTDHAINCSSLNAVIIWRRDYVAHPRNPTGVVSRKFANEEEILLQVRKTLGPTANVTGVQLDRLTMKEQLRLMATCDMLIGMHGAGLTHVAFLPSTSGFLEIFPFTMKPSTTHFQAIGKWRKLAAVQLHNKDRKSQTSDKKTRMDPKLLDSHVVQLKKKSCPR